MNTIDFSNLGGLPLTQTRLDFLQQSYLAAFSGLAKFCGDKTILTGVEVAAGAVSDGWIAVAGELIPFIGGAVGAKVIISSTSVPFTFADTTVHDVQFTKTATCGGVGGFDFTDLVPLLQLQNIWLPGDVKQKYCDNAYIAANFDGSGYGTGRERGWRILTSAYPDAAGRVMANVNSADAELDECGKIVGAKTGVLVQNQLPASMIFNVPFAQHTTSGGTYGVTDGPPAGGGTTNVIFTNSGGGQSHSRMQPSFVLLYLIKL